ncbi:MAG: type II toxin-antitoxin system VapC family toxin [Nanoarchaeota archaeon]
MEKSFYIDSNVFIFAYTDDKENGVVCRKILDLIIENKIEAFTSTLTFDEIFNKITKLKDKNTALIVSDLFLNLNNLKFIEVSLAIINDSLSLLKQYNLGPRDSIHLACALYKNISKIITNDKDFDKIKEIKRFDIKDFK